MTWDEATFREYIKDPKAKVPGTKMVFVGVKDDQKITDLIAFLKQYDPLERKHRDAGGELVLILAATVGVVFAILAFAISWGIRCWEGLGPLVGDHR